MKFSLISSKRVSALAALGLLTGLPISAQALTWVGGSGTWNETGGTDWSGGSWINGSDATFNSGTGDVIIGAFGTSLDIATLDFTGAGQYRFDNSISPINGLGGLGSGTTININGAGITGAGTAQIFLNSGDLNFNNSASAGNANISVRSINSISFNGSSLGGSATVTNYGLLNLNGNSDTGGLTVANGGTIDASLHSLPTVNLGTLVNVSSLTPVFGQDFAGTIRPAANQLQVGNLTLSNADPSVVGNNVLEFALTTENTGAIFTGTAFDPLNSRGISPLSGQGRIMINPLGTFNAPTAFTGTVDILITSASSVDAGTYTLIDWSNALNVNGLGGPNGLDDFNLIFGPGVNLSPGTHLEIQQGALVLVAVPEPATIAMPLAACLGLLMIRRRASRMAAAV